MRRREFVTASAGRVLGCALQDLPKRSRIQGLRVELPHLVWAGTPDLG